MIKFRPLKWNFDSFGATADAFGVRAFYKMTGAPGEWTLMVPGENSYRHIEFQTQRQARVEAQVDFNMRVQNCIDQEDI